MARRGPTEPARIAELRTLLAEANRAYYADAAPTMADSEFDHLMHELIALEALYPELADPASPSQRVGGAPIEGFETAEHAVPMQSIDNTYSLEDLAAWYERVVKGLGGAGDDLFGGVMRLACDPKIDGIAISLRYEDGVLVQAVTRGDGQRGDDVTAQVRTIRGIPLTLRPRELGPPTLLEVRGEIYMPNTEFERINEERFAADEPLLANARNATAGTLKSLDPRVAAARRPGFVAHGRGEVRDPGGLDAIEGFAAFAAAIKNLGVPVSPELKLCDTLEEVVEVVERFRDTRASLGYGVDGMVIRVDRFDQQEQLGATSKAPRWLIAFKYPAEQGTTTLLRVDWQVGKNGTLTPRATMEPIFIAGTTVQHATLHNIEEIHRKDIRVGDTVVIEKAGEIIPQVIAVVEEKRKASAKPIPAPKACPACGGAVEPEGPKLYCVNPECPAQFRERVKWFVGRGQMDIDGMGEKLVDQLVDADLLTHFADVFTLRRDDLLALPRLAEKSVDNLLAAIDESKARGLARVLAGMGIRQIGAAAAKTLARNFSSADALVAADVETIEALPDFGEITSRLLHDYLHSGPGRDALRRLAEVGVDLSSHEDAAPASTAGNPFDGQTIVLTGTLESFGRRELGERLETLGARIVGSVSAKTDLLIAGANPGSKFDRAQELGIEVWDEERLRATLEDM